MGISYHLILISNPPSKSPFPFGTNGISNRLSNQALSPLSFNRTKYSNERAISWNTCISNSKSPAIESGWTDNEVALRTMPDVSTWAKLAAYVVCIGLVLELAHRVYWQLNHWIMSMSAGATLRALLSTTVASIPLMAVLAVTGAFCIYVDQTSLESLGLYGGFESFATFMEGAAIAFAAVTLLFLIGYGVGWFKIERSCVDRSQVPAFCGGACDFALGAVFEEIAIRGYVFSVLDHAWGPNIAVGGSAVVFSIFHLIKHPRIPLIFTINAVIFGLLTAQARLVTGNLWAPIGLHIGWNFAEGPIFGLPSGGQVYKNGLVCSAVEGPEWITGGLYSPDAGILGTFTLGLAAAALLLLLPML